MERQESLECIEEKKLRAVDVSWILPYYSLYLQQREYKTWMEIYDKHTFRPSTFIKLFHHQLQVEKVLENKIVLLTMFVPYFIYHKIGFKQISFAYYELNQIEQAIDMYIPNNTFIRQMTENKKQCITQNTIVSDEIAILIIEFTGKL